MRQLGVPLERHSEFVLEHMSRSFNDEVSKLLWG
jgi:hypothetical protein